jgi:two-component system sensor histidine kinase DesK
MSDNDYFNSEKALNSSGILVIALIGSLAVYTLQDSWLWPFVALLASCILIGFSIFLIGDDSSQKRRIFWILGLLITVFLFLVELDLVAILTIVWIVQAAELYGPRRASFLAVASLTVFLLSQVYHNGMGNLFDYLISAVIYGSLQVFALSAVQRAIRERTLREETAVLNRELVATRELLSQTTAQAERVRIARNLHDILGHHMTALILNLEVANHSVKKSISIEHENPDNKQERKDSSERQKREDKAQEKVEQALALAKLLLGDIRTAVSELREDDRIDLKSSIEKLAEGIPNLGFEIDSSAAPPIRSVQLAEILLRCSQEAITNVIRHSNADACRIAMTESQGLCVLAVADNGSPQSEIVAGNGIKGMQERVAAIGGTLDWEQSTQGFSLRFEVPLGAENED